MANIAELAEETSAKKSSKTSKKSVAKNGVAFTVGKTTESLPVKKNLPATDNGITDVEVKEIVSVVGEAITVDELVNIVKDTSPVEEFPLITRIPTTNNLSQSPYPVSHVAVSDKPAYKPAYKPNNHFKSSNNNYQGTKEQLAFSNNCPEHIKEFVLILKNNSEIRRFTALGVINYLIQKGDIPKGKAFVEVKWDRFTVSFNGLNRDYPLTEIFFLNCLVASFVSFANAAQNTINTFMLMELNKTIGQGLIQEDVDRAVESVAKR